MFLHLVGLIQDALHLGGIVVAIALHALPVSEQVTGLCLLAAQLPQVVDLAWVRGALLGLLCGW